MAAASVAGRDRVMNMASPMPQSVGPDGADSDTIQSIQLKINQTTDQSLDSTRRMVALCEDGKDAGIRTLVMLDEQGEQLDKIEEGMDKINNDMKNAEKNLEGLEKCCGLCVLPWKRTKNFEKSDNYAQTWTKDRDGTVNTDGPRMMVGDQAIVGGGYITRVTNDAREDEMENNLIEVSGMLNNLRNMAIDIGDESNAQIDQINRIGVKTEMNEVRIDGANKRANKLLRN